MTVVIPMEGTRPYTLYAKGNLIRKNMYAMDSGIYLTFKGVVVLNYTYKFYRKRDVRIVKVVTLPDYSLAAEKLKSVPQVVEPVFTLYSATGRKIDLLRRMIFILEKHYKDDFWTFDLSYWGKMLTLLDIRYRRNLESAAIEKNIIRITDRYIERGKNDKSE